MIEGLEDIIGVFEKHEGGEEGIRELAGDENLTLLYEEMMEAKEQFDVQYVHVLFGVIENWYEETGITNKEYIMGAIQRNFEEHPEADIDIEGDSITFNAVGVVLDRFLDGEDISPYLMKSFIEYMQYVNGNLT